MIALKCAIISDQTELTYVCKNEHEPPLRNLKIMILEKIGKMVGLGYDAYITNCDYGIPLWSSEIVVAMKMYNDIRLDIVIPYEEQTTNWIEEYRDRYYMVHEAADSVYLSSKRYCENCDEIAYQYMIDNSDAVLVFGKKSSDISAVSYAQNKGRQIILIDITEGTF